MSRGNNVFQVLIPTGNQAILAKDQEVGDLAPGQIGFFNYNTNLSIDTLSNTDSVGKNFYIAVGVDRDADGTIEDVNKSAGTHIQQRNIVSVSARCYTPAQPKIVELTDFTANCEEEYGVKFEIRNQQAYRVHGFNQVVKTFVVRTEDCDGCEGCPSGDCISLATALAAEVNGDEDGLILAEIIAQGAITIATHGTSADYAAGDVVSDADIAVVQTFNETAAEADVVCLGLRFTVQAETFKSYCSINLNYFAPRQTDILPVAIGGFEGNGTVTVTQDIVYEEGSGYDVKQLEYEAGGWNGRPGPYRTSELLGMPREGFEYFADVAEKYNIVHLMYDQASIAGWMEHKNNQGTIIAIPIADDVTKDAIGALFSAMLWKFDSIENYLSNCPADGTTVNSSTDIGETFADGIGTP